MDDTPISSKGQDYRRRFREGKLGNKQTPEKLAALDAALAIPPIGSAPAQAVTPPIDHEPEQPDLFSRKIRKPAAPSLETPLPLTMHDIRVRIYEQREAARQLPLEIPEHEASPTPQPERTGWRVFFASRPHASRNK